MSGTSSVVFSIVFQDALRPASAARLWIRPRQLWIAPFPVSREAARRTTPRRWRLPGAG